MDPNLKVLYLSQDAKNWPLTSKLTPTRSLTKFSSIVSTNTIDFSLFKLMIHVDFDKDKFY